MHTCIGKPEKYTHPTSSNAGLTSNTAGDCKAGRQEPALKRSIPMRVDHFRSATNMVHLKPAEGGQDADTGSALVWTQDTMSQH